MIFKKQPYLKRMLAMALAAIMLFAQLPMSAFAVGASQVESVTPENSTEVESPEVESAIPEDVVTLDTGVSVKAKTLYAFTPEQSGVYCFYSVHSGDSDPKMQLLDANKQWIAGDDDGGENLNFELNYELTAGTTYYVEADAYGNRFPYELWVVESKISSIEIVSIPTFVTEEYDFKYGGWTSTYQGEIVDRYFVYFPYSAISEAVIKVNYKDGTSEEISNNSDVGRGIYYEWDFYNDPWEVGEDNHYYLTYKGLKVLANATLTASPVTHIELMSAEIPEFVEYDSRTGYWQNYYEEVEVDEKYFYYAIEQINNSIKLKVTYEDGTTEVVSYYDEKKEYTGIRIYSDQFKNPWTVGENEFEIWYRGACTTATATVVENPVESIRVVKTGNFQYNEFDDNYGYWVDESQDHFYYEPQHALWDVVLEVTYNDGTTELISYDYGSGIGYFDDQHNTPWTVDGENSLTIIYMGLSTTINVTIKPGIVESITVADVVVTEGTNGGYWEYETENGTEYWFHYDVYAEDVTVTLVDGTTLRGSQDYIREELNYSISYYYETPQYRDEPWGVGEYTITASLMGKKAQFKYIIEESDIESISVDDLEVEQYTCGYWNSGYWDPETGEHVDAEWYYYQPAHYAQITVTYKDGTTFTGSMDELTGKYDVVPHTPTTQSYKNQWQANQTYSVTTYLMGKKAEFNVTIAEPNITKIEVIDTQDFIYYEYDTSHGQWHEEGWFYYEPWDLASKVTIRVTYKDGTTEDISWWDENGHHTGITFSERQYETPWTADGENLLTIIYQGAKTTISAVIQPSPIASIVVDNITYTQYTGGYWNEGGYWEGDEWIEGDRYYYYYLDPQYITITFADGRVVSGTMDDIYKQTGVYPSYYAEQNRHNQWGLGDYTAYLTFMGKTVEYTISVVGSNIASITAPNVTYVEGTGGWWNGYYEDRYLAGYYYYYNCMPDQITVTFKDGTSITGTCDEIQAELGYRPETVADQGPDNRWGVGTYTVKISLMGAIGSFDITVTPSDVVSITADPVSCIEHTNGHWVYYYDENGEQRYYTYHLAPENITVTFADGTTISGSPYFIREQTGYEVTFLSVQHEAKQWGLGANTAMVSFKGKSTEFVVNIVESPIESIIVDTVYLEEGTHGCWYYRHTGDLWFQYEPVPNQITIRYKDGTELKGSYNELYQQLNGEISNSVYNQEENPWGLGTYTATFSYMDISVEYDVVITPTRIQSITVIPVIAVAGKDGWHSSEYYDPISGNWHAADWYAYDVNPEMIKATFTDGTEFFGSYEDFNALGYNVHLAHDQSCFNEWGVGVHTVTMNGVGFVTSYEVMILEEVATEDYGYVILPDGTAALVAYYGSADDVIIPETIDGYAVTVLGQRLFQSCSIRSVTIPATVQRIEKYAFAWNHNLTKVLIYVGVEMIGECAFLDCYNIESVSFYGTSAEAEIIGMCNGNDSLQNARWIIGEACTEHEYDNDCDDECNICGALREADHAYEWVIDYAGNCLDDGYMHEECTICHKTRNVDTAIPSDGSHDNTELIHVKEANCGEWGYTGDVYCYDCQNYIEIGHEIEPNGNHGNTTIVDVREATCGQEGYTGDLFCYDCYKVVVYGESIPAKSHENTGITGSYAPTCGQDGYTGDLICYDCNTILEYGEAIPNTGNHGALTIIGASTATCNQAGYTGDILCKNCKTIVEYGDEIPATGKHVYDNAYDADCNECGTIREVSLKPATLTLNGGTAYQGDTLRVDVTIDGNTGFAGLQFGVLFDDIYLTLKNVETQMEGFYVTVGNSIVFDAIENYTADGVIATLIFEIAENAPVGEYAVQLRFMSGSTENFEAVVMTGSATTIRVESAVVGDANGDGRVDTIDLVMLRKYLAAMDPITKVSDIAVKKGADANEDGVIDAIDLAFVRQYLASMSAS